MSRERAQGLILAGRVRLGDEVLDKPGRMVAEDAALVVEDPNPFVSRGGVKLAHALATFGIDVQNKTAADIGASTGGFTDCLLQNGAARVYAFDVGYGQLDWKLQSDERVILRDRFNARHLTLEDMDNTRADIAVIDVSFISLKLILPPVFAVMKEEGDVVALVKPQFEVGKDEVEHKGVIRDPAKHEKVLLDLTAFVAEQGWVASGLTASPITGQKGNREYLLHCVKAGRRDAIDSKHIGNEVQA
ncbi:TlyA family RNA methyltransferase [Nitrospina gracilis]|uniref:TlyA family RNA methyltransferase n=1 Tax=Nitrospina gracilis TaxID=35801 RepID=UPI001F3837AA|nr:23S rRNA (cytidine1920-2'-O)/16S rRNA (cytidine1409-2'-O)-methyltransferase [Nitrospina gracilis Nb-211]